MGTTPCTLIVPLKEDGYCMVLDTARKQCMEEPPHWHLSQDGVKVGQISWNLKWQEKPSVEDSIIKEAEESTIEHSRQIREFYYHNRMYGNGSA